MKRFLLLAGANFYPSHGMGDWVAEADSYHEIESELVDLGRYKGCIYKNKKYDWYELVDLDKMSLSGE
jgi:hypothetical protein